MKKRRQQKMMSDRLFEGILFIGSLIIMVVFALLVYELLEKSQVAMKQFGLSILWTKRWDPVHHMFGALPLFYGTLITSLIGVVLATITGVSLAIVLSQYDWPWFHRPMLLFVDGLSAIPSVIYGLWGMSVIAFFHVNFSVLAAGLILALMVLPTIVSNVRRIMMSVPVELKQGALAIGATKEEMIHLVVLPFARQGILGSAILGLTRAFGETIAIVMVIGNQPHLFLAFFDQGETLTGILAKEFAAANSPQYVSSLYEIAVLLCIVTVLASVGGRFLVASAKERRGGLSV